MGNRKIYRIVILLFVYASQGFTGENKSFFYYYNPDVVIQSAYIGEGPSIEYSFPDFATFSHLRLNIEMDSLYAVHLGIGLYDLDAGISINPYRHNDISLRFRFDIGSGIKSFFFMQILSTFSIKRTLNTEYGINIAAGITPGFPLIEIHRKLIFMNTIEEYWDNSNGGVYMKEEFYYLKFINNLNIGLLLGISHYFIRDKYIAGGSNIKLQIGFSISYYY